MKPKRTSVRAPWQNGIAERWIGSARRDCFDHVIALNETHVRRLGREFIAYYEDRTHLGLDKDTPSERLIEGGGIGIVVTGRRATSSIRLERSRVNMRKFTGRHKVHNYRCVPRSRSRAAHRIRAAPESNGGNDI
jgi:hypothetical protein